MFIFVAPALPPHPRPIAPECPSVRGTAAPPAPAHGPGWHGCLAQLPGLAQRFGDANLPSPEALSAPRLSPSLGMS